VHPFSVWVELFLVADTFLVLYGVALLAQWLHRPPPAASADARPARVQHRPSVPEARETQPYRMDAGVAVSGPEAGRHERVGASQ